LILGAAKAVEKLAPGKPEKPLRIVAGVPLERRFPLSLKVQADEAEFGVIQHLPAGLPRIRPT
jgi:hypothetical protein